MTHYLAHDEGQHTVITGINLILLIGALVAATGFVGIYASHAPWRVTVVGKSMMLLALSVIGLIMSGLLYNAFGPDYPFRDVVRVCSFTFLNIALWYQLSVLVRAQNADFRAQQRAKLDLDMLGDGPDSGEMRAMVADNDARI